MKSLTILAFLAALLIVSCTDTSIVPIKSDNQSVHLIKLPPKAGLSVENTYSVTKTINGVDGGTLKIKESYVAEDGHTVKIDVKLKIKKNSFIGEEDVTMTVDDLFAAVRFTPHMVFSKPAKLDVKFEGINLKELELVSGDYDFIFIDGGYVEDVEYNTLNVKESRGKISVKKAKINHFSRYAFAR
jgi:hypothetical protein